MGNYNREHLYKLTNREIEVLTLMSQAMSNREISEHLGVGIEAVRLHAKNIYAKLEVSGRQKASLKAQELGLINIQSGDKSDTNVNLPSVTLSFVGRTAELGHLHQLQQSQHRLITILGAGGMGKTQLALAYSHQVQDQYADGVVFIPLDAVTKLDGIIFQMVDSLGLKLSARADYKQEVLNYLADKNMLLILDNFEHLLDDAILLTEIINATVDIQLIVTSRERLLLTHETPFRLSGLSFPDTQNEMATKDFEAVELIQQLAQQIVPGRQLDTENSQYIVQLCQITQGMPLGIMLAMSWLDVYELPQIIKEIQNSIDFLQTDMRDMPKRHRDIRSVFEWTWQLLSVEEQTLFMKLSVFRNGCNLDAIQTITGATPRMLKSLINKALLYRDANGRYSMHALLRQYGEQKLQQDTKTQITTHSQHAYYYATIAELIMSNRLVGEEANVELENLYVAWRWGVEQQDLTLLWQLVNTYGIIAYQLGCLVEMKLLYEESLVYRSTFDQLDRDFVGALLFVISSLYAYSHNYVMRDLCVNDARSIFNERDLAQQRIEVIYATFHGVLAMRRIVWDESLQLLHEVIHALECQPQPDDHVYQTMLVYAYAQKGYILMMNPAYQNDTGVQESALHALQMAKAIQHKAMIGFISIILGQQASLIGKHHEATEYFRQADDTFKGISTSHDHGAALLHAGVNAYMLQQYDVARTYLHRALEILKDYGLSSMVFLVRFIGYWKYHSGDIISAVELITFADKYVGGSKNDAMTRRLLREVDTEIDDEQVRSAVDRGKVMDFQTVLRELYIWLED